MKNKKQTQSAVSRPSPTPCSASSVNSAWVKHTVSLRDTFLLTTWSVFPQLPNWVIPETILKHIGMFTIDEFRHGTIYRVHPFDVFRKDPAILLRRWLNIPTLTWSNIPLRAKAIFLWIKKQGAPEALGELVNKSMSHKISKPNAEVTHPEPKPKDHE